MSDRTRVCFVTGTRAEFGLLAPLIAAVQDAPDMQPQIIAAAAHLVAAFGRTKDEILARGFKIDREVDLLLANDAPAAVARSMGLGLIGFASAFEDLKPDVVVLLGDRFEALSAAAAAAVMGLPIAHLHGGEITLGAVDESIRHAISKLSRLHFVAAEPYRRRIVQMGEDPAFVFDVGAIGLQAIDRIAVMSRAEVAKALGLTLAPPVFLITYHPPTAEQQGSRAVDTLLQALAAFPKAQMVFTGVNADAGHVYIGERIGAFVAQRAGQAVLRPSLGQPLYVNVMRQCDAVIGNSSSGLIEAPHLHKASVDIGRRQEGRLRAESVLSCPEDANSIAAAIKRALSAEFQRRLPAMEPMYRGGDVASRILAGMRSALPRLTAEKPFHDAPGAFERR
jgi:UDP-N-acetylglucosamine 2-epimerase (non-hydrolysing)/GDP/UDP-N,N'-diacetylbacillosamine 2-epimerase (hydrolysing)